MLREPRCLPRAEIKGYDAVLHPTLGAWPIRVDVAQNNRQLPSPPFLHLNIEGPGHLYQFPHPYICFSSRFTITIAIMPPAATENVPAPAPATAAAPKPEAQPYLSTMPSSDFSWQITLANKVIAITGANRGIGLGIAEVCLANSAKFVYSFDLMEPGEDFAELQKRYSNFRYIQTDVTSEESIENAINKVIEETGRIDGLVANAGMTKHQPALKFDREQLDKLFNLNVSVPLPLVHDDRLTGIRFLVHTSALKLSHANSLSLASRGLSS